MRRLARHGASASPLDGQFLPRQTTEQKLAITYLALTLVI